MTARLKTQRRRGDGRGALQGAGACCSAPADSAPAPARRRPHCSLGVVAAGGRRARRRRRRAPQLQRTAPRAARGRRRAAARPRTGGRSGTRSCPRGVRRRTRGRRARSPARPIARDAHADRAAPVMRVSDCTASSDTVVARATVAGSRRPSRARRGSCGGASACSRTPNRELPLRQVRYRRGARERGAVNAEGPRRAHDPISYSPASPGRQPARRRAHRPLHARLRQPHDALLRARDGELALLRVQMTEARPRPHGPRALRVVEQPLVGAEVGGGTVLQVQRGDRASAGCRSGRRRCIAVVSSVVRKHAAAAAWWPCCRRAAARRAPTAAGAARAASARGRAGRAAP